jgi:hypothetical protein
LGIEENGVAGGPLPDLPEGQDDPDDELAGGVEDNHPQKRLRESGQRLTGPARAAIRTAAAARLARKTRKQFPM